MCPKSLNSSDRLCSRYYELVNDLTTKYVQRTEDLNCENRDVTQEDLENVRVEITERTRLLRSA